MHGNGMRELFVKKKKRETAKARTQGPLKKTARVGTQVPLKETAKVRPQEPLKEAASGRTQEPSREGATKRKCGEFRKRRKVEEEKAEKTSLISSTKFERSGLGLEVWGCGPSSANFFEPVAQGHVSCSPILGDSHFFSLNLLT